MFPVQPDIGASILNVFDVLPEKSLPKFTALVDPNYMENTQINPVLRDMVSRGQLNQDKISELVRLKGIVDRFASVLYVSDEEALSLEKKYGASPDIKTWGDYFQSEIASRFFDLSLPDFIRIVDTVRFDLISSVMIFQGKSPDFFEKVEEDAISAWSRDRENWSEQDEEAAHLQILSRYFAEMSLHEHVISEDDQNWFNSFVDSSESRAG